MLTVLLFLLMAAPAEGVFEVEALDGETRSGTIIAWEASSLTLRTSEGERQSIPLDQVLRLERARSEESRSGSLPPAALTVRLTDGSQLAVKQVEADGNRAILVAPQGMPNEARLEIPLTAIHSVRQTPDVREPEDRLARLETQWNEIATMRPEGDLIVVRKVGADTINYVAGAIGTVGPEKIAFTLDQQQIEVARERVFGWIYYRAPQQEEARSSKLVFRGQDYQIMVDAADWKAGAWQVHSPLIGQLELSGESLEAIDMSAGKVLYLSDLEPRRAEWTPPPTLPLVGSLLEGIARDRGFYSSQLWLEYPPESLDESLATSAGIPRRVAYRKGLALRAQMELAYRLPGEFRQFRAVAGIDPQARAAGTVVLRIMGDGKELLSKRISGDEPPQDIACSVEGVRQLEVLVGFENDHPLATGSGGALHLGQARLTR